MLSETLDSQRRALIPGRSTTLVLLTAGAFVEALTTALAERLGAFGNGAERVERVVEPLAMDPVKRAGQEDRIARVTEAALLRNPAAEIEIQILVSAWQIEAGEVTEVLEGCSGLLSRLAAGNQSLTLRLLVPPSSAPPADLSRAAAVTRAAAARMGDLKLFTAVLVDQLPGELLRADTPEGGAFASADDLLELLSRGSGDADLARIIQSDGVSQFEIANRFGGEPAVLSTLGLQRVVYLQHELLRYLQARFQWELFHRGLFNPALVSASRRALLTQQAEDALGAQARDLAGKLSGWMTAPSLWAVAAATVPSGDPTASGSPLSPLSIGELARAVEDGQRRLGALRDQALDRCETALREQLDRALDATPGFFADGAALLDAIAGEPGESDPPTAPTGLFRVEELLCVGPLLGLTRAHLEPRLGETISRLGQTRPAESARGDPSLGSLEQAVASLLQAEAQAPEAIDPATRLLGEVGARLIEASRWQGVTAAQSEHLLLGLGHWVVAEQQRLVRALDDIESELADIPEQRRQQRQDHPLWRVWELGQRRRGLRELKETAQSLAQQRLGVVATGEALRAMFRELFAKILWPYHVRVWTLTGLRERVERIQEDFDLYTGTLRARWDEEWRLAQQLDSRDSWTVTTVNSLERFAVVYDHKLAGVDWLDQVRDLLAFTPRAVDLQSPTAPPYLRWHTLSEHFHAPLSDLTTRTLDYGERLFEDARTLHILDIIELLGVPDGQALLGRILDKTRSRPELSSGPIPALEVAGLLRRHRLLRAAPAVRAGLTARYDYLLVDTDDFAEIPDPEIIDITACTFGFPVSLLHVLTLGGQTAAVVTFTAVDKGRIVLATRRDGKSHTVSVTLEGANEQQIERMLVVDTGADVVTLPASMIPRLGFSRDDLTNLEVQTANGKTTASHGTLPAVWLTGQRIADVAVGFVEDDRLGNDGLLGMSVLGRFQVTIDDEANRLILGKR